MKKIFLYGAPGSGKSTIGKMLAQSLDVPFVDLDNEIEAATGKPILEIITQDGEDTFRGQESAVLLRICADTEYANAVVSLGGGALLIAGNRTLAESAGDVVFIETRPEFLASNIAASETSRPLLSGNLDTRLNDLLEKRKDHYLSFKIRVATSANENFPKIKKPEDVCWDIQTLIGRFHSSKMGGDYDIIVEPGGLDNLAAMLVDRKLHTSVLLVCDEIIDKYLGERVIEKLQTAGIAVKKLVIPTGEENKSIETIAKIWKGFLKAGLDRKSTVIAMGGGVVGDLVGFAAATYMRGCNWIAVPTTLLSMVDASMGGKTGFDLPEGKNLIGAFYPPKLVLSDPLLLNTLPKAEFLSGMAEVVKHGVISDPELFEQCSKGLDAIQLDLTNIIRRAVAVKIKIIEQDPYEKGLRATLNLGHTIGHAVEVVSRFQLKHGEAVAIGMVAEARLAEKLGLVRSGHKISDEIKSVFWTIGLPTEIPL